ncbi:hypothetical protein M3J09_011837 [Ascochyta lentis]
MQPQVWRMQVAIVLHNVCAHVSQPMYVPIEIVVDASLDSTITRRNDFIQLVHTQAARLRFDL